MLALTNKFIDTINGVIVAKAAADLTSLRDSIEEGTIVRAERDLAIVEEWRI